MPSCSGAACSNRRKGLGENELHWNKVIYCALLGFVASLALIGLISLWVSIPEPPETDGHLFFELVGMAVVSPLVETGFLWLLANVASRFLGPRVSIIIAALFLAALHAIIWKYWPIVIAPVLLASSVPLMVKDATERTRVTQSFSIHALNNVLAWSLAYASLAKDIL